MLCQVCGEEKVKCTMDGAPGQRVALCAGCHSTACDLRASFTPQGPSQAERYLLAWQDVRRWRPPTPEGRQFAQYLLERYDALQSPRLLEMLWELPEDDPAAAEVLERRHQRLVEECSIEETDHIGDFLSLDEKRGTWCVPVNGERCRPRSLSALLDMELVEKEQPVTMDDVIDAAKTAHLFGPIATALAYGGNTEQPVAELSIRLTLSDPEDTKETIPFLERPVYRSSVTYRRRAAMCQQALARLRPLLERNRSAQVLTFSVADELRKLKDLMDEGALTRPEFEAQKKKLLAL